jgi:hypothetical protein
LADIQLLRQTGAASQNIFTGSRMVQDTIHVPEGIFLKSETLCLRFGRKAFNITLGTNARLKNCPPEKTHIGEPLRLSGKVMEQENK